MDLLRHFPRYPAHGLSDVHLRDDGVVTAQADGRDAHWTLGDVQLDNQYVLLTMRVDPSGPVPDEMLRCELWYRPAGRKHFDRAHVLTHWIRQCNAAHTYAFKCVPFQRRRIAQLRLKPVNCPARIELSQCRIVHYEPFDPAAAEAQPASDLGVIFLSYYSRTGSTLAMKMLTRHPQITGHTEGTYDANILKYFSKLYFMFLRSHIPSGPKRDQRFLDRFRRFSMHYKPEYALTKPLEFDRYIHLEPFRRHYSRFLLDYLPQLLEDMDAPHRQQAKYYVEKQMDAGPFLEAMLELLPRARVVAVFRDPRDVLASLLAFQKKERIVRKKLTPDELAEEIMDTFARRLDLVEADSACRTWFRYEDLLARPTETIRVVLGALELDASDEIVSHMSGALERRDLQAARHLTAGDVSRTVGRWRGELGPDVLRRFERHVRTFERLGYAL
ncbi:MAG: sulfotransferase [Phycisphaerae bacterium]|nr:sulfotransferase [Phycisphaerae bacterium]